MITINRNAIVLRPGQPFLDWLQRADPTSVDLKLEDLQREPTVYMIPECDSEEEAVAHLAKVCGVIFEEELDGWYRFPSSWPQRRDFDTFQHWFKWSYHSEIVDLCSDPLIKEAM
jgi:hypothetical protein